MKFEVNINKKYFVILASLLIILAGSVLVYTFNTSNPTNFGHSISELDFQGFCIFSPTATQCPNGWTRSIIFDNSTIRGSSTGIGETGGSDTHTHTVNGNSNTQSVASGSQNAANNVVFTTSESSSWPPYVNVTICCK